MIKRLRISITSSRILGTLGCALSDVGLGLGDRIVSAREIAALVFTQTRRRNSRCSTDRLEPALDPAILIELFGPASSRKLLRRLFGSVSKVYSSIDISLINPLFDSSLTNVIYSVVFIWSSSFSSTAENATKQLITLGEGPGVTIASLIVGVALGAGLFTSVPALSNSSLVPKQKLRRNTFCSSDAKKDSPSCAPKIEREPSTCSKFS
mmetsp:Transcript_23106/g.34115  ORF Transcript_23106/g.34115 Transcript_23106/m.34115 type:complete len:209 (+) Transcript_23106:5246-5872(+)